MSKKSTNLQSEPVFQRKKPVDFFKRGIFSISKWQHLHKKNRKERHQYVFIINCQKRKIAITREWLWNKSGKFWKNVRFYVKVVEWCLYFFWFWFVFFLEMGRSRSNSPRRRDRDRDIRDRDRERHRERRRRRSRERSRERRRVSDDRDHRRRRSYTRSRSRSFDRERSYERQRKAPTAERPQITAADLEGKSQDEQDMLKTMGFCNFDTTKGKKVEGNDVGAVHVILKRKYRQYMNRKGGFNRPLDFVAWFYWNFSIVINFYEYLNVST